MNAIKTLANRFRNGLNPGGSGRDNRDASRRPRPKARPRVEGLEGRELMTGSATLNSGVLMIEGTRMADSVAVVKVYDQIVVEMKSADGSHQVGAAPASAVKGIVFFGLQGNDVFTNQTALPSYAHGGQGNDLLGSIGPCVLIGGKGDDVLVGGAADDTLFGNEGNDVIDGGAGDDLLYGGQDNDYVIGGVGDDTLYGNKGVDLLLGGADYDILDGGDADDFLDGGSGYDRISDGAGANNYFYDDASGSYAGTGWMVKGHAFNDNVWALDILNLIVSYRQAPSQSGDNSWMFKSTPGSFWSATIPELGMTLGELTRAPNFWHVGI